MVKELLGLEELTSLGHLFLGGCRRSQLTHTLTKPLFQMYSGFEKIIDISLGAEEFPDWIIQSSVEWSAEDHISDGDASSSVNLQPNLAHSYLGMILCFDNHAFYSVMTTASNIFESHIDSSGIVIVPRSIFTVTDTDHTITFASRARRHWIHLLYKNEDNSITLNVADEENTPSRGSRKRGRGER
nr:PREDICTED: uncharacterized protein LOC108197553 isoform X2 [Daucus carota subsp. sativus]